MSVLNFSGNSPMSNSSLSPEMESEFYDSEFYNSNYSQTFDSLYNTFDNLSDARLMFKILDDSMRLNHLGATFNVIRLAASLSDVSPIDIIANKIQEKIESSEKEAFLAAKEQFNVDNMSADKKSLSIDIIMSELAGANENDSPDKLSETLKFKLSEEELSAKLAEKADMELEDIKLEGISKFAMVA